MDPIRIDGIQPGAALPGGEFTIRGSHLMESQQRPEILFGEVKGSVVIGSESMVVARVPDSASTPELIVRHAGGETSPYPCAIGIQIADALHPVASPAVDAEGNIFTTFSGSRGQKTSVSVFRIDTNYQVSAFNSDIMNATGLAFDSNGLLHVSSRNDGAVFQVSGTGEAKLFVEGMGIATGLCFDPVGNLYVGDRSGTVFKVDPNGDVFVFATLEPSISAYHLAYGPGGYIYVTGPTTSSHDSVYRIAPDGSVETFYRGLGRPQGIAFDRDGNLYVCASWRGKRGVVRISPSAEAEHFLSGHGIVGLAFLPSRSLAIATTNSIYRVDVDIAGL